MKIENSIKKDLTVAIAEHARDYFNIELTSSQVENISNKIIQNALDDLDIRQLDRAFYQSGISQT